VRWAAEERIKMTAKIISFPAAKTQAQTAVHAVAKEEMETDCTRRIDLSRPATVAEIEQGVGFIQTAWTARWVVVDKIEAYLKECGFDQGINVKGDYDIDWDEHPISWEVSRMLYFLVTNQVDANGYIYENDFALIDKAPDFPAAVGLLSTSKRIKTAPLSEEQIANLTVLLGEGYAKQIAFTNRMSNFLFGYVHDHVGCIGDRISEKDMDEIYEFMSECRHAAGDNQNAIAYEKKANQDFVNLINKIQVEAAAAAE
jgi:hypothetical protein